MAKRVTTQELAHEIDTIKNNHLAHMAQDIDELKDEVKESRQFFQQRLDRLDNKIMWILGILLTSSFAAIAAMMTGAI